MHEQAIVSDVDIVNGTLCFHGAGVPFKNLIDHRPCQPLPLVAALPWRGSVLRVLAMRGFNRLSRRAPYGGAG